MLGILTSVVVLVVLFRSWDEDASGDAPLDSPREPVALPAAEAGETNAPSGPAPEDSDTGVELTTAVGVATESHDAAAPPRSSVWLALPRDNQDVGRFIALAPKKVTGRRLVRNVNLNPADIELEPAELERLSEAVAAQVQLVDATDCAFARHRHEVMERLEAGGQLTHLTIELVPEEDRAELRKTALMLAGIIDSQHPERDATKDRQAIDNELSRRATTIIEGAAAFITTDSKTLVATSDQLHELEPDMELRRSARRELLQLVLGWFLDAGLLTQGEAARIAKSFERYVASI